MVPFAINWCHKGRQHVSQCDSSIMCRHLRPQFLSVQIRPFQVFLALGLWAFWAGQGIWSFLSWEILRRFWSDSVFQAFWAFRFSHQDFQGLSRISWRLGYPARVHLNNYWWISGSVKRGTVTRMNSISQNPKDIFSLMDGYQQYK